MSHNGNVSSLWVFMGATEKEPFCQSNHKGSLSSTRAKQRVACSLQVTYKGWESGKMGLNPVKGLALINKAEYFLYDWPETLMKGTKE